MGVIIKIKYPKLYLWKTFQDTISGDSSDENVDEYIVIDEFNGSDTMSKGNEANDKTLKPSHTISNRVENEVKGFLCRK